MTNTELLERKRKQSEMLDAKKKKVDAQIKELAKKEAEQTRKHRTHMLIELGASICSLYGKSYLDDDEIRKLYDYLQRKRDTDDFTLEDEDTKNERLQKTNEAFYPFYGMN